MRPNSEREDLRWRMPDSGAIARYTAMVRPAGHVAELDGLRALAIFLVVLRHGINPFRVGSTPMLPIAGWDVGVLLTNGWAGVDLFFVLSGYLITAHLLRHRDAVSGGLALRAYLAQRALRILPAYYTVLIVAAFGAVPHFAVNGVDLAGRVAYHFLFFQDYLPSDIVVAFWSLGVEEKFYLTIPVLLAGILRLRDSRIRCAVIAVLIVCVPLARYSTWLAHGAVATYPAFFRLLRSPFHLSADALLTGTLVALVADARRSTPGAASRRMTGALFHGGAAIVAVVLAAAPHMDHIGAFDVTALATLLALGFGAIVLAVVLAPNRHGSWLRGHFLHVVARLSYSLYLVHLLVIPGARILMADVRGFGEWTRGAQFVAFLPLYLVLSVAASLLLHFAVEKPFLLVKERIQRRAKRAADQRPKSVSEAFAESGAASVGTI